MQVGLSKLIFFNRPALQDFIFNLTNGGICLVKANAIANSVANVKRKQKHNCVNNGFQILN